MFTIVNMQSPEDDRTARARIRDEALRLFAERGPDAVTVREIATAAGVSPALVIRHYTSKERLRESVENHVVATFDVMLAEVTHPGGARPFDNVAVPALAEVVVAHLPADSPVPAYLARMLLADTAAGSALFRKLHAVSQQALAGLVAAGAAATGSDPDVRAAFLLVNDLAVLMLRSQLEKALGVDPLSVEGLRRWGAEALAVYRGGLSATPDGR